MSIIFLIEPYALYHNIQMSITEYVQKELDAAQEAFLMEKAARCEADDDLRAYKSGLRQLADSNSSVGRSHQIPLPKIFESLHKQLMQEDRQHHKSSNRGSANGGGAGHSMAW
jgi:uncharacterized protein